MIAIFNGGVTYDNYIKWGVVVGAVPEHSSAVFRLLVRADPDAKKTPARQGKGKRITALFRVWRGFASGFSYYYIILGRFKMLS